VNPRGGIARKVAQLLCCALGLAGGAAVAAVTGAQPDLRSTAQAAVPTREAVPVSVLGRPDMATPPEAPPVMRIEVSRTDPFGARFRDGMVVGGGTRHRLLLFTFDDGPDRHNTLRLLDYLDEAGVRAVFFLTASQMLGANPRERWHQRIAKEIVRRGHLVGSHTLDHVQLPVLTDVEVRHQLRGAEEIFEQVLGARPWLLRPPGGSRSPRVDGIIAARGYTTLLWNVGTGDFQVRTPEEVLETWKRVLERREADYGERGGIVLLHDTHEWSVEAFPRMIQEIRDRNCRLLEENEELYDIVDDPSLFFAPRGDAEPTALAPLAEPDPSVLAERQAGLRERTAMRCRRLAAN